MHRMVLLGPLVLMACSTVPSPPDGGLCRDSALGAFAGREATPAILAELQRTSGAKTLRVLKPGMMITMEFSAERVTVYLTPGNRIERASCG
jgi:hypothetical protein